ncbi:polysaccharide deacetylase family sporulation protein PdaB [Alkalicoccobacillus porphyridii]|uniref:Polysaccharide deacetylase family sporulation protein PdaB n=1 Tax=Alkalicoccobacillus porphyridii TaxID=2597270 RepID=A0A553ZTU4_9BACI|nr:polysaccharide deacetylase family sporulation protein PdaB [Alkalicoccobacillus porphyridii]TSB44823.1 polysaccharide deacetylase family sporulation protein PdaB [Alkalicoccobacillus porphyridii]
MNGIWVINAKNWRAITIILVAAFFAAGWIYLERNTMSVFTTESGPQAFYRAETDTKNIALTFNVSWGEERLTPILDALELEGVEQATFFISASWAERYPELAADIHKRGFTIGNHGYQYKNYDTWEQDKVSQDIVRSQQILTELAEEKPALLRPPNGAFNQEVLSIADKQGLSIIHWSVDSKDYQNPGTEAIVHNVLDQTQPGDVILFHASDTVKQTDKALPEIIKGLRDKGYTFSSIEEMMTGADSESSEVQ